MGSIKGSVQEKTRSIAIIMIAVIAVVLFATGAWLKTYTSEQLYKESVSQLGEVTTHLLEKLYVKIDLQWGYLEKVEAACGEYDSMTEEEVCEVLTHYEKDLSPTDSELKFRLLDENGHYYTDEGRQGMWTGIDKLSTEGRQSFLITNWLDNNNYMAFVIKNKAPLTVDGREITHFVLLRSMADMEPFFQISAFDGRNIAYIIEQDTGVILSESGSLKGVEFSGMNLFTSMEKQTYPHTGNFSSLIEKGSGGGVVCTNVIIGGEDFYVAYDKVVGYDWSLVILVSQDDVAATTSAMVTSLLTLFMLIAFALSAALAAAFYFITRFHKNKKLLEMKERSEAILEKKNIELEEARKETEKALVIAKSATKAKSQFLANMSHDIRTPMNAIVGVTKLMENSVGDPEKLRYYIKKLQQSGRYMLGLINDILDMSKIEAGEVHINYEPVKIAEQVGQIESIIRSQANEKNQTFTVSVKNLSHEYVISDSIRLRQVFLNLLTNAVKYTQPGGDIHFELTELPCDEPDCVRIHTAVRDNGYGMTPEFKEHIFEAFTREISSTTNKVQGTGLGMCITKSIVELMGGSITVESELDKGSCFEVTLTLPIDNTVEHETPIDSVLLLSADDELIANVGAALREMPVRLDVTSDIDRAIAILKDKPTETVLIDDIPRDQVDMLRSTSEEAVLIFCCEYAYRANLREKLADSGVDGFVARPFFYENLITAVQNTHVKAAQSGQKTIHSTLQGKKFLCAEDNELNAEILEALLKMNGATCVIYPNGEEIVKAFADVKEGDYDAILMDIQMPVMNGLQATQAIRNGENELGKTIPIIAMTANAFDSDVRECLAAGMDMHIAKPLDISTLERAIQELTGENIPLGGGLPINRK